MKKRLMTILYIVFPLTTFAQNTTYNFNFGAQPVENEQQKTPAELTAKIEEDKILKRNTRELGGGISSTGGVINALGDKPISYLGASLVFNSMHDRDVVVTFGNSFIANGSGQYFALSFQRFYDWKKHTSLKRSINFSMAEASSREATVDGDGWSYYSKYSLTKFGYGIGPEWHYKALSAFLQAEGFIGYVKNTDAGYDREVKLNLGFALSTGLTIRI